MSQRVSTLKRNFTAGELKKTLHAAEELGFYNNGAKRIENMIVLPEGGLARCPGTRFVTEVYNEAETGLLMPFKFSRNDTRVVCFNGGKGMVFKSSGFVETTPGSGVPYTFNTPWNAAALVNLRWGAAADVVFVADGATPKLVKRLADNNWSVSDYPATNGPVRTQNTDTAKTIGVSAVTGSIALTSNFDIFAAGHIGTIWRLDEPDLSLIPYWTASETVTTGGLPAVSYRRYLGRVYRATAPPGYPAAGSYGAGVNPPTQDFGQFQSVPDGVVWEFVYETFGFVQITAVTDARNATATVLGVPGGVQTVLPDSLVTKPTYRWSEPAWSSLRSYPTVVGFVQQRVAWLDNLGQFWISQPGDYYSFRVTPDDSSAVFGQMLSMDGSVVQPRWAVSNGWILVGASDSEPLVRGPGAYDAITKSNVTVITDKGQGSASHVPAIADAGVAFIGGSRQRLNYAKTNRLIESINVDELSVASNHVLKGRALGLAYQHDPHRILWGYSADGALWAYTFRPDQQVVAAHRHPRADAYVESVATMYSADGEHAELWLLVRRVINGVTRRFVEVLQPFFEPLDDDAPTAEGAWFYDCALEYVGPPVTTLSGLDHLAGATVGIFLNGQDLPRQVVSPSGTVTIPLLTAATIRAVVGLPLPFAVETLDMSPAANGRTTRGGVKRATHAAIEIVDGYGLEVSVDSGEGPLEKEIMFQSGAKPLLGAPMPLETGRHPVPLDGGHGLTVRLIAEGDHGYPMTIIGLAPDLELSEI
jgi:hypothetical protein